MRSRRTSEGFAESFGFEDGKRAPVVHDTIGVSCSQKRMPLR